MSCERTAPLANARCRTAAMPSSSAIVRITSTNSGSRIIWMVIRLLRDAHELLAEILALQHAHEGLRRILKTIDDVLAIFDFAFLDPLRHVADEVVKAAPEIRDDEAADDEALGQDRAEELRCLVFHVGRLGRAVLRDQPTHRNARERIEQREHRVPYRAGDVLEIDIDAFRTCRLELLGHRSIAMVDAVIEAELVLDVLAFVGPARDADRARAFDPGDL